MRIVKSIYRLALFIEYNEQHRDIEKYINTNWPILKNDKHLSCVLPDTLKFINKKAP